MKCPLCGCKVRKFSEYNTVPWISCDGLASEEVDLYMHVNLPEQCPCDKPVCPECGKDFQDGNDYPFRRFALHWCKYGHLKGTEHAIVAAMNGDTEP